MTPDGPPPAGTGAALLLNSPLTQQSLTRLLTEATAQQPRRIVDHGCGWAEALLQALNLSPEATGMGVEVHEPDLARAAQAAEDRGLADRVGFVHGRSPEHRERADLLLSMGAYQAFGDVPAALKVLREDLRPGGRALFCAEYWRTAPTQDELAHMWPGASLTDCFDLAGLVEEVHAAGWRVLALHDSTRAELDDYEVGHLLERELWLLEHPDHPVREELDRMWMAWLRGHRRSLGFVSLVIG